jgi:hypothetical protein
MPQGQGIQRFQSKHIGMPDTNDRVSRQYFQVKNLAPIPV